MNRRHVLTTCLILVSTFLAGQDRSSPQAISAPPALQLQAAVPHRFGLDDVWSLADLSDVQVSPDGRTVMVVVSRANPAENRYDRSLVAIGLANGELRTVSTPTLPDVSNPRWSLRGNQIAFLAR